MRQMGQGSGAVMIDSVLNSTAYPEWKQAQEWLGLTRRGIRGIGLAPLTDLGAGGATPWASDEPDPITTPEGEGPATQKITLDDEEGADSDVVPNPDPDEPEPPAADWPQWPYYPPGSQGT